MFLYNNLSLSMVVCNSRGQYEKQGIPLLHASITHLRIKTHINEAKKKQPYATNYWEDQVIVCNSIYYIDCSIRLIYITNDNDVGNTAKS